MFAQLGTTIFDGSKSFVSFEGEESVELVEHALVSRKPKLFGGGQNLRKITIALFLHQEFCKVSLEENKLRTSMQQYEVLPLLWGNGQLEGYFVIASLNFKKTQMDGLGNTLSATVNLALTETDPPPSKSNTTSFAVGNKKPATKSNRSNELSCARKISRIISSIRSNDDGINSSVSGYSGQPNLNANYKSYLDQIVTGCNTLLQAISDHASCIHNNIQMANNATAVKTAAQAMYSAVQANQLSPLETQPVKKKAYELEFKVRGLWNAAAPIRQAATLKQ
jgi:phage protein U